MKAALIQSKYVESDLINPVIWRVLQNIFNSKSGIVFAITGDIDNLGIFVAKHGRAEAENIVDLINQFIRLYIQKHTSGNKEINDVAIVLNGEEVFIIGHAFTESVVDIVFINLTSAVNDFIVQNKIIPNPGLSITFGIKEFNFKKFKLLIRPLFISDRSLSRNIVRKYYRILESIRNELAVNLDVAKFTNLSSLDKYGPIVCRNIVYHEMIGYKVVTTRVLNELSCVDMDAKTLSYIVAISKRYGLNSKRFSSTAKIVNRLKKKK